MANLSPNPKLQFFDANGNPLSGGKLYTYAAGTTTPLATYTSFTGGTPNANPVVLDSRGEANVWLGSATYKFKLTTSTDVELWTVDNISSYNYDVLQTLAATGGASLIGFIQSGSGAVAQTVQSKLRQTVNLLDFNATGNGTADDTTAVTNAIATGKNVYVPKGYTFAVTGNVTGFTDGQIIYGGGKFKKLGTTLTPIFLLPDESSNVWFDGLEFDGTIANFTPGNAVPAILGYLTKSLKVTNCYFHDIIDAGIKLRDGANLYAAGNTFYNVGENGIELHNYATDPRTGSAYVGTRPVIEGNHTIIGNRFEKITRYENPAGPLVDACGVLFVGATGYKQKNIRIIGNVFIDCLRHIWTENNTANSESDGVVISGNTMMNGVNGGTAQNIYGKAGIGIIAAKNVVITDNTFKNIANTNPVGTETACIIVSGSAGISTSENIEIANNSCVDDSGGADKTEWGIYCLIGTDIRIRNNFISGVQNAAGIYLHPSNVTNAIVYANRNADSYYSWNQIVPLIFARENVPANGNQSTYVYNMTWEEEAILPTTGRVVGVSVKLSTAISAGDLTVKTYANGVEQTNLQITTADFSGVVAIKRVNALANTQITPGQRYKVVLTTSAAFLPTTTDAIITVFVDIGPKQ